MRPDAWARVSEALDRLLDRPAAERDALLRALRADDPDLAREVEALLAETAPAPPFDSPPSLLVRDLPPPAAADPTFDSGRAGPFEIVRELARGGMGAIYRATDPTFGRPVAVKVLLPRAKANPDADAWFDREATLLGRLAHPGIPPVYARGRLADGTPYFAMKLVEGRTLADLIAIGGGEWVARRVGTFEQVCRAIGFAHSRRVVHRDLKPGNVMVGAFGEVQVMDWGLAADLNAGGPEGGVAGTPAYMAPEQARGERVDERADVFGLGALLVATVTGQPPYIAPSAADLLTLAAAGDTGPALDRLAAAGADADLVAIATRCLKENPTDRYRDAGDVADAVTAYREGLAEKLRRAELDRAAAEVRAAEERRRRRVMLGLAASLAALVVGGVAVWAWADRVERQRRARAQSLNEQTARVLDEADAERAALLATLADPARVNAFLNDAAPWDVRLHAVAARVDRAAELAENGRDVLDPALSDRLDAARANLSADRADYDFAKGGDALRAEMLDAQNPDINARYRAFADLYARRGWDLFGDPGLAETLTASPIRWVVQANLDDLASLRMTQNVDPNDAKFRRLIALARGLETDEWRRRVRDPDVIRDPGAVDTLTRDIDPRAHPPQMIRYLASLRAYVKRDRVPLLRAAVAAYPNDLWLLFDYAELLHRTDPVEALAAQRAALALRPTSFAMWNNLGTKYMRLQNFDEASVAFRRCLELNPKASVPAQNLAYIACERDPTKDTIAALHGTRTNSRFPDHFSYLGTKYALIEEYATAEACYKRAVELAPQDPNEKKLLDGLTATLARRDVLRTREAADPLPWAAVEAGVAGVLDDDAPFDQYFFRTANKRRGYRVRLDAGVVYSVRVRSDVPTDVTLETEAFRVVCGSRDTRPRTERFTFAVPAAGIYRLTVVGSRPSARGRFELTGSPARPDPTPVTHHGTLSRTDDSSATRYRDHYRVSLRPGESVLAAMKGSTFEPRLVLYDTEGNKLLESMRGNPFDMRLTRFDYTATQGGTYTVTATSVETDRIGGYTVELRTVPETP